MATLNVLVLASLLYVVLLFAVAFAADRAALHGRGAWLRSPWIYTLSLSIYCTAWTFYGAVGFAARSGLEFLTIYLGPTLIMIGWWWTLRKLVRIGRSQRITSIADLISSRYGKSNLLAVLVTILAVIGTTPYIALQLQSVTLSFAAFAEADPNASLGDASSTALWVALGLTLFTILFGTRNLDANERHHGVVMAIALEAVVKLFALLAVGIFVVWGIAGGVSETFARIDASEIARWDVPGSRWVGLTLLSAAAFLCLPRMFQVMVVENEDEGHLRTASWAFPAYLMLMSLFVVPIAAIGLDIMPAGANPDLFVLTLPLQEGREGLAILSFLGGFSSATSMVIVAAIALSTMLSNHVVMPVWLRMTGGTGIVVSGDVRQVALLTRRLSIAGVVLLGYVYLRLSSGGAALAAIGLVSFAGVAQLLPAMLGGLFWRGATRIGALTGLLVGFAIWLYTLFLPSFGPSVILSQALLEAGPFGISWLRPRALFGVDGMDPLVHAVMWSMLLNTFSFIAVSILSFPKPLERLQGAQFVNVFQHSATTGTWSGGLAQSEDLLLMSQRILGAAEAQSLFSKAASRQGLSGYLPEPSPDFLQELERELSGSVGGATAHAMISQIVGGATVSVQDLMAVADETAQIMEYSSQLEAKSEELARTARQLRAANTKLTQISEQKDTFLSQISHELRTPMTSIRAFSEILRDGKGLSEADGEKYSTIIHDETVRLTRLLDDLLDLSVLENGQVVLNTQTGSLSDLLQRSVRAAQGEEGQLEIKYGQIDQNIVLTTDLDRLAQVFINLITNARKYCDAKEPVLTISTQRQNGQLIIDFVDNGSGIPADMHAVIFEKFSRISHARVGGAGLGLAICAEIMTRLGGSVGIVPAQGGSAFRVILPPATVSQATSPAA